MKEGLKHFQDYLYLLYNLHNTNVAENAEYQKKYNGYWVMGRQSHEYYKKYFSILENNKNNKEISFNYVIKELNSIDNKIQFSFSSKLIHMINNEKPIYDKMVSHFYNLPDWNGSCYDERIKKINRIYDFLIKEYKRVKNEDLLSISVKKARSYYDLDERFTDEKIMDSIIWMFIKYVESGIGKIKYK